MRRLAKAVAVASVMVGIGGSNLEAQEDARQVGVDSAEAKVWQNMHHAGMIWDEEYQHAVQYGALAGGLDVEGAGGLRGRACSEAGAQGAFVCGALAAGANSP